MNFDEPMGLNQPEEANSSQPTAEGNLDMPKIIEFDSDALLDPPNEQVGDKKDLTQDGKVKKEILELGEGVKRPRNNYICNVSYKAYFFDHQPIEEQGNVNIAIGDLAYPEGLSRALLQMRQNENAKIKIKKKMGFGRKQEIEKLRWPQGFDVAESEQGKKLRSKGVIYEVKLNSWVERYNLDGENSAPKFLKTYIRKADKPEWEKPDGIDEVIVNLKAFVSPDDVLFERTNWELKVNDKSVPTTLMKIIQSLKRGELSKIEVDASAYQLDPQLLSDTLPRLTELASTSPKLIVEAELVRLIKVEDWFKDEGSCLKRVLRKGKGGQPSIDSIIKMRLKIEVDGKVILNNFPSEDPLSQDLNMLSDEEKQEAKEDPSLYTFTLDEYRLPKLLLKVLKSLKRNEVSELRVNNPALHLEKLRSNFTSQYFDQYAAFEHIDQSVVFTFHLLDTSKEFYFYQLTVAEKLARVKYLKGVAGQFFQVGNFKKAAKLYQKINGYYNFGDVKNNHAKEDEESEDYQSKMAECMSVKITTFMNLVVCKYKLKEYSSIIGITDQVIEMDPTNVKCLYFRGKAFLETEEYSKAVESFARLVQIDPNHVEGRKELENAKKIKKQFLDNEHKKYSRIFS